MAEFVTVYEVGPRDGLQNEKTRIATEVKIELVDRLSLCGFRKIEVTSFVNPRWIPQLADAADVMAGINRNPETIYAALTPNIQGYDAALAAGAGEVAIFASASEAFSQHNINCSIGESIERFKPVMKAAKTYGIPVRGYLSCITDCPYSGPVAVEQVVALADTMLGFGCYEISLGDTIGAATPDRLDAMLFALLKTVPAENLAGHFHDTNGLALANVEICLKRGLRTFDTAVNGLGGCPYAPGAKGNVATEAVCAFLGERGYQTGIDPVRLEDARKFAERTISRS